MDQERARKKRSVEPTSSSSAASSAGPMVIPGRGRKRPATEAAEDVEKMNEEKMINALNSNVKLGCLQAVFDKVKLCFPL